MIKVILKQRYFKEKEKAFINYVKNSCEFTDFIRDKTLDACEELVSFDVVSLFTKIPVDLAVKVA